MRRLAGVPGFAPAHPARAQFPIPRPAPLLPVIAAQLASYPFVQITQRAQHFGKAEVRFPTKQGVSQLCHDSRLSVASRTTGQLAHLGFRLSMALSATLSFDPGFG